MELLAGNLGRNGSDYRAPGLRMSGAASLGISSASKALQERHNRSLQLELRVYETLGEERESIRATTAMLTTDNVSAIIGPMDTCLHEVSREI